jgi:hypothetical protein
MELRKSAEIVSLSSLAGFAQPHVKKVATRYSTYD